MLKLGGSLGRVLVIGVFVIGLVGCVLTVAAARTQHGYYVAVRDQMVGLGRRLSLGDAAIATTPGARRRQRTWLQRVSRVQNLIYATLAVTGIADVLGAVYVIAKL